ncbi:MAG: peptidoglycan DD-metalloendopeptidase family protein [Psychromonas sp.]
MLALLFVVIFAVVGCSSPSYEHAPVADVTIKKNSYANKQSTQMITGKTYKVKKGDTLYSIAWRGNLDVNRLAKYNNLSSPYVIHQGQKLTLIPVKKDVAKTTVVAKQPTSQKTSKNVATSCADQSCKKKTEQAVVVQKTKEYPAKTNTKKVVKKEPTSSQKKEYSVNSNVSKWYWPTKGKLTNTFSSSQAGMKGISINNQRGTAITAAAAGKVVYAGSGLRGFGNLIIIKHNDDYLSAYAHNEKLLIKENDSIKIGQKIALMGDSGTDTVKLHFEIRYRGKSVDPLRYLPKR